MSLDANAEPTTVGELFRDMLATCENPQVVLGFGLSLLNVLSVAMAFEPRYGPIGQLRQDFPIPVGDLKQLVLPGVEFNNWVKAQESAGQNFTVEDKLELVGLYLDHAADPGDPTMPLVEYLDAIAGDLKSLAATAPEPTPPQNYTIEATIPIAPDQIQAAYQTVLQDGQPQRLVYRRLIAGLFVAIDLYQTIGVRRCYYDVYFLDASTDEVLAEFPVVFSDDQSVSLYQTYQRKVALGRDTVLATVKVIDPTAAAPFD